MQKYKHYQTIDFLSDDEFIDWVCDPQGETNLYWQEVFALFPYVKEPAEEARQMLLQLRIKPLNGPAAGLKEKILEKAFAPEVRERALEGGAIRALYKWMVAALVLICAGALLFLQQSLSSTKLEIVEIRNSSKKQFKNTADRALLVALPDQSTVILQPKAYLTYQVDSFVLKREVFLVGEAFFDISKNQQTPFIVNTDQLMTTVLGTSFFIKANPDMPNHKVLVATGAVRVKGKRRVGTAERKQNDELVLRAGQEVLLLADRPLRAAPSAEALQMTEDVGTVFDFQNMPMSRVAEILEAQYGVNVEIKNTVLAERTITAFLANVSLQEKLNLIAKAVEARYQLEDGVIIFSLNTNQQ